MKTLSYAGITDVGRKRSGNEDAFGADARHRCYVISDGMGGHGGGEVASKLCVSSAVAHVVAGAGSKSREALALGAVVAADAAVRVAAASASASLANMGATILVVIVGDDEATVAHVGDSRLYRRRAGALTALTTDHRISRNVLSRAVGHRGGDRPDVSSFTVARDDVLLLCTDGVTGELDDAQILGAMRGRRSAHGLARGVVDAALAAGGSDNITALAVLVG